MAKEKWMDVVSFEGIYKVSDMGRIKSIKFGKARILSLSGDTKGYQCCMLYKNKIRSAGSVHQLVAMSFLGHIPNGHTMVVDHKNGNPSDNRATNLRIVSKRENSTTCYRKDKGSFTSKFAGVYFNQRSGKWAANIQINGKQKYLGTYIVETDAANAYLSELRLITT